jgi:hypothetical protein
MHFELVTPDTYHPPLSIDVFLTHVNNNLNSEVIKKLFVFTYVTFSADKDMMLINTCYY